MTNILCIETATEICSVALSIDGKMVSCRETSDLNSHSERLTVFIAEILSESNISIRNLDAVAISMGPGSYTGLRIGTSTAKGFCFALDIPLIAVSTLASIANGARQRYDTVGKLLIPMIDARRMEVYMAVYADDLSLIDEVKAVVVDEDFLQTLEGSTSMVFCGNGVEKCADLLRQHPKMELTDVLSSAAFMADIAYEKFNNQQFEDLAYFEPFYLKDFIAAQSYVKGLR